ncbi:ribonuclease E/G [Hyphomicrobium sp. D-2]|uniref:Rne/Rng family ribonuclease n=1 Tax=Hyphomicrobium sp. D-2 TaxID=3041621 RepID=UPI0024589031|nr:ribonuclease E/G [Hyphomicrobium sp. D-2]MDH4983902.1 ribonuclease E/G [Hyphomicrobium sp. D-2]
MSNNKMLIDATHPEETRVVVLRNGRVEEFDFESAARKLLRGNIYLAKVTRVEPSLQAAFVEYGGNRHGFLAFNEIHPDYYQIPMADRQALLDEEAAAEAAEEAAVDAHAEALARRQAASGADDSDDDDASHDDGDEVVDIIDIEPHAGDDSDDDDADHAAGSDASDEPRASYTAAATAPADDRLTENVDGNTAANENTYVDVDFSVLSSLPAAEPADASAGDVSTTDAGNSTAVAVRSGKDSAAAEVEHVATGEDALEELVSRPRRRPRSYKIQEVIKRRQVILVQVVKEERGNKGAALTTYLSLAGRYTVLMPNTARGGGISRKITQPQDRKRLKAIAAELEVPEGMGLIIRTAGAARTKQEIKRDFEYLLRLWESVRDLTLESQAPDLVYEEGDLIKRSIRDLYNKDIDEVVVAGDEAHHEAKDFMRMLMPSHAKNVTLYQEPEPLFTRFQIERQLNAMFSPYVTLRSGGYLVINQTEALVAIDVNSGKATREFSIEETAYHTNLEAADEIARQLQLRDLAGLIVIDFIDMEEKRNNRAVERRLKEALRFDRARIQVGHISHFGLMEMSRQRLRTGVLEGSTSQCPHCQGTGIIRSTESVALAVLRGLEDAIMAGARTSLIATTTPTVALYILNNKRPFIIDMEARLGLPIMVTGSDKLAGANFTIEKGAAPVQAPRRAERNVVNMESGFESDDEGGVYEGRETNGHSHSQSSQGHSHSHSHSHSEDDRNGSSDEGGSRRRRRRRRGGRRGERENGNGYAADSASDNGEFNAEHDDAPQEFDGPEDVYTSEGGEGAEHHDETHASHGDGEAGSERTGGRRRRRGRRGGRRGRERNAQRVEGETSDDHGPQDYAVTADQPDYYTSVGDTAAYAGDDSAGDNGDDHGHQHDHADVAVVETASERGSERVTAVEAEAAPLQHSEASVESASASSAVVEADHSATFSADAAAPAIEAEADNATEEKESAPAPRRSRASRSAAKAAEAAESDAENDVASSIETAAANADAERAPTLAPVSNGAANAEHASTSAAEAVVEPAAAPRRSNVTGEPRLERVVISQSSDVEVVTEDAAPAAPARKGWWQRKLGGGE